ncbi:GyrI-like domain-containing protein [Paenibacillus sp. TRM 82003]|nr:GyrI-like domain-containing protein [Paenibacillus sp. TRM 82003]
MEVEIINRPETRIVGFKVETLLKDTKEQHIIPKLQQRFNEIVTEIPSAVGLPVTYGVFVDPPDYKPDTDLFTWIAGVESKVEADSEQGLINFLIPAGTYAVIHYEGDLDNAGSAYDRLYHWVQGSDYEMNGTYGFEMYSTFLSALERKTAAFRLHFPIKNKTARPSVLN